MAGSFDSDDLMRRSLFASLFGFRNAPSRTVTPYPKREIYSEAGRSLISPTSTDIKTFPLPSGSSFSSYYPTSVAAAALHCPVVQQLLLHRAPFQQEDDDQQRLKSKADIYREIVDECSELERSATTSPVLEVIPELAPLQSEYSLVTMRLNGLMNDSNSHGNSRSLNSTADNQNTGDELSSSGISSNNSLPPAELEFHGSCNERSPSCNISSSLNREHPADRMRLPDISFAPEMSEQLLEVEEIKKTLTSFSFEEFLKYFIAAVKGSAAKREEDPEVILRRKRLMNNEAAARYRKKQKEERVRKTDEVYELQIRNQQLKQTVEEMTDEINKLREAVLFQSALQ